MTALQSERLVKQVKNVYENVEFYRKKMDDMGVRAREISKGLKISVSFHLRQKKTLRANYPFGLLAVPQEKIVRVQGTSGTTGKLTLASYTQKDIDVWGECVARGLTMAGLTCRRPYSYLLWIWIVHRRNGAGFRSKKAWSNGYPDVSR